MSLVINTNTSSLNTQNNLSKSGNALSQATERLSSGLKINSAADNAAGFAISQRYTTQIGGLAQASANASDAINLAQTAGSALDQVTANLQAIRDLAAQSANGTYSDSDRATIDKEVQQRLSEVTRIANQTTFNGKKVLDGSLKSTSFQIGADVGQSISVSLDSSVKASALGQIATSASGDLSGLFKDASGAAQPLTLATGDLQFSTAASTAAGQTPADIVGTFNTVQDLSDAVNAAGIEGVTAAVNKAGGLTLYSNSALSVGGVAADTASAATNALKFAGAGATVAGATAIATGGSLDGSDVKSVDNANALISRIDVALGSVSDFSAQLGAVQNRFQSTISTLSSQSTNLQSSQSTIQDADFAAETAALSKAQVLQQAGISVLAQANSRPQQVLKLLG